MGVCGDVARALCIGPECSSSRRVGRYRHVRLSPRLRCRAITYHQPRHTRGAGAAPGSHHRCGPAGGVRHCPRPRRSRRGPWQAAAAAATRRRRVVRRDRSRPRPIMAPLSDRACAARCLGLGAAPCAASRLYIIGDYANLPWPSQARSCGVGGARYDTAAWCVGFPPTGSVQLAGTVPPRLRLAPWPGGLHGFPSSKALGGVLAKAATGRKRQPLKAGGPLPSR